MNSELKDMMLKLLLSETVKPSNESSFWQIGKSYLIRTVTMYQTGKLKEITANELVFEQAAWIADCGRFHTALKTGEVSEVEPFVNDVMINRTSIIDATFWPHALPLVQK